MQAQLIGGEVLVDRLLTVHDLKDIPETDENKLAELHDGILINMPGAYTYETSITGWIIYEIITFMMESKVGGGVTGPDGTAILDEYNTRLPDVSYITKARNAAQPPDEYLIGAPDLAVEVYSDVNTYKSMQRTAVEYLAGGSSLVWIVYPYLESVHVYRKGGSRLVLDIDGVLDGYDVLPGLSLSVARLFNPFKKG